MSVANNLKKHNRDISPMAQYDNEMSRDISLPLEYNKPRILTRFYPYPTTARLGSQNTRRDL